MIPYFIVYLSRSGSTLLSRLLNEFQDVCVTTEASFPPEMIGSNGYDPIKFRCEKDIIDYVEYVRKNSRFNTWEITDNEIIEEVRKRGGVNDSSDLFISFLSLYGKKHKPEADIIVYKGFPAIPWEIKNIRKTFPDSKFIYPYRDPNAIFNSQKKSINPYHNKSFTTNPAEVGHQWKLAYDRTYGLGDDVLFKVKYEDLVLKKDRVLEELVSSFLEVSTNKEDKKFVSFDQRIPEQEREIHKLVGKNPDHTRINAWEKNLTKKERIIINALAYPANKEMGYLGDVPKVSHILLGKFYLMKYRYQKIVTKIGSLIYTSRSIGNITKHRLLSRFKFTK